MKQKLMSHFSWIVLAFLVGIGATYMLIEGSSIAYGEIYKRTEGFILKNYNSSLAQSTPEDILDIIPNSESNEVNMEAVPVIPPKIEKTISIGFVGDIIPGINAPANMFSGMMAYTNEPDVMIGNFEGAATKSDYVKCTEKSTNCFSFKGDANFLNLLGNASFDVLNVANNHFNDYGDVGQAETLKAVAASGIVATGIKNKVSYITKNELKIGVVGFSTNWWTNNMNNVTTIEKLIGEAKENSDIVVAIFHGGGEGGKYFHTPSGTEWYLEENRGDVRSFAHNAIDAGADLVLGSGPHVLRGIEKYQGKLIAYSLGNFSSADSHLTNGSINTSAMLETVFKEDGTLLSGAIVSVAIDRDGIPYLDFTNTAVSIINELSASDFGDQGAILTPDGVIENK